MATVEAIKNIDDIEVITKYLAKYHPQYKCLFKFGLNVALRITDLLNLKWEAVNPSIEFFEIREQKTGKLRKITLNGSAKAALLELKNMYPETEYVFQSMSNRGKATNKPLSRQSVLRVFKEVQEERDLAFNLGTHSMRKTFGYHQYLQRGKSLGALMQVFGHSSEATTLRYIGITQDDIDATYTALEL